MKIRRYRLRCPQRCRVLVEPAAREWDEGEWFNCAECRDPKACELALTCIHAQSVGPVPIVVTEPRATPPVEGVHVPEPSAAQWGMHPWAFMNRWMAVMFGITLPMPKKEAPWSPNPVVDIAEF